MSAKTYRVVLHRAVLKELSCLPAKTASRFKTIIDSLAEEPVPRAAMRLRGRSNAYRIRQGNYRLLYEVHATEIVVYVVAAAHRKDVYRRLLRRHSQR